MLPSLVGRNAMNTANVYYTKSMTDSDPAGPIHIEVYETTLCGKDTEGRRWFVTSEPATCKKCLKLAQS